MNANPVQSVTLRDGRVVHLRSSAPGDGPAVHAYICALGLSTEFILTHANDLPTLEAVNDRIEKIALGKFYSLVAIDPETNDVIANASFTVGTRKKLSHIAELGMGVLPAWQGVGLGALMLDRAVLDMHDIDDIYKLELTVMKGNDHALRMYERAGFIVEGCKLRAVHQPDGSFADEIIMGMWIGD